MNKFFSQLHTDAEKIRLTDAERAQMRGRLLATMDAHAAPAVSPYFSLLSFVSARAFVPALALLLVVGSATAYAAEGSLPGDILYPVKVGISEPVRGALAVSDESKAAVHAEFAERRLIEAETLAAKGVLTVEAKQQLEESFERHADEVDRIVEKIEEAGVIATTDISASFASNIAAHHQVIAELGDESDNAETKRESRAFASKVASRKILARSGHSAGAIAMQMNVSQEFAVKAVAARSTITAEDSAAQKTNDPGHAVAAERIGAKALAALVEAETALGTLQDTLGASTTESVQQKITDIRTRIDGVDAESGAAAQIVMEGALSDAVKLRAFLEVQNTVKSKVFRTFIENTVPDAPIKNPAGLPISL